VGRILLALIFIASGAMGHLAQRETTVSFAKQTGAPAPEVMVPLTGVTGILGGLMVILGIWGDLGALILALMVVAFAMFMHAPWDQPDEQAQQEQTAHFMKNLAIAGGLLVLFWIFNQLQGEAPLTLTDPLFGRG
jgi:putative oxidoreductase